MKHKPFSIAGAVLVVVFLLSSVPVSAEPPEILTWAPGGDVNAGGTLPWMQVDYWRNEDNDQVTWVDGSSAVFHRTIAGSATVTVSSHLIAESITFTLGPEVGGAGIFVSATAPFSSFENISGHFHVGEGAQLTFTPSLQNSTNGLTLDGGGGLLLQPGTFPVASTFTGDIVIHSGILTPNTDAILGDAANEIFMGDNAVLRPRANFTSSRNIHLTGAATYQLDNHQAIDAILSGVISGDGQLAFTLGAIASSRVTLSGSNTYTGGTVIDLSGPGLVIANNNDAFGTGEVSLRGNSTLRIESGIDGLSNNITVESAMALLRVVFEDESYHVGTTGALASGFNSDTASLTARILAGTSGLETTLEMRFSPTSAAENDELRASDIFMLDGLSTEDASYVLQLSSSGIDTDSFLAWVDDGLWVNAVLGNTGNNASEDQDGFLGSFSYFQSIYGSALDDYIGAWGVDTSSGDVWAVLNHYNASFAILPIPEPMSAPLVVLGGFLLIMGRRKRQRVRGKG